MRKFAKFWIVILLVAGLLGVVLLGIGAAIGGDFYKASEYTARGPFGIHFSPRHWEYFMGKKDEMSHHWEEEFHHGKDWKEYRDEYHSHLRHEGKMSKNLVQQDMTGVDSLKLKLTGMEEVTVKTGDSFALYLDGDENNLSSQVEKGTWKIKTEFRRPLGKLILVVPKDMKFKKVDIELDAGLLWAENITTEDLELELTAGSMALYQVDCEKAEAEMMAGQIQVYGSAEKKLDVEVLAGSLVWTMSRPENYSYKLENSVGTITIGDQVFEGLAEEKNKIGKGGPEFDVECMAGEAKILFEEEI